MFSACNYIKSKLDDLQRSKLIQRTVVFFSPNRSMGKIVRINVLQGYENLCQNDVLPDSNFFLDLLMTNVKKFILSVPFLSNYVGVRLGVL